MMHCGYSLPANVACQAHNAASVADRLALLALATTITAAAIAATTTSICAALQTAAKQSGGCAACIHNDHNATTTGICTALQQQTAAEDDQTNKDRCVRTTAHPACHQHTRSPNQCELNSNSKTIDQ
jgi:hypothetical protein